MGGGGGGGGGGFTTYLKWNKGNIEIDTDFNELSLLLLSPILASDWFS